MWYFELEGYYEWDEIIGFAKSSSKEQWCELDCVNVDEEMGWNQII